MVAVDKIIQESNKIHNDVTLTRDNYLYYNPPQGNVHENESIRTSFQPLFSNLRKEFDSLTIDVIVKRFRSVVSEFYAFTDEYYGRDVEVIETYMNILDTFIFKLCDLYGITLTKMTIFRYKYTPTAWGNLYWNFFHYSSILVSHAYETGMIKSTFYDFGALLYNIDAILPCDVCKYHYRTIKDTPVLRDINVQLCFGLVMSSTQYFHNIISDNINKTQKHMNPYEKMMFMTIDYASKYECLCLWDDTKKNSEVFVDSTIDWQPLTHRVLTIILSTYCRLSYIKISNLLKEKLYQDEKAFSKGQKDQKYFELKFKCFDCYSWNDVALTSFTTDQIWHCLRKCLLLQFDETTLKDDDVKKNQVFKHAIIKFFEMYPSIVIQVIRSLPDPSDRMNVINRYNELTDIILKVSDV